MQVASKVVVGCLAASVGFVAFVLVLVGLTVVTMAFIPTPDDRTATILGVVGFGAAGVIGVTVTWKMILRLAHVLGVRPERELVADWLRPQLEAGKVIRALLAGAVIHDAPGWSEAIPVLGGGGPVVTLGEFLESTCSLALTDRRIVLVLKRPIGEQEVRAYPISSVRTTGLDVGWSRIILTLHPVGETALTLAFNYVLDGASKHDAEVIANAFEGLRN